MLPFERFFLTPVFSLQSDFERLCIFWSEKRFSYLWTFLPRFESVAWWAGVTWWDILKKLLDSEQESLGLQSLLCALFKCLCVSQHFNLETAARLGSTCQGVLTEVRQPPLHWSGLSLLQPVAPSTHYCSLEKDHTGCWTPVSVLRLFVASKQKELFPPKFPKWFREAETSGNFQLQKWTDCQ